MYSRSRRVILVDKGMRYDAGFAVPVFMSRYSMDGGNRE